MTPCRHPTPCSSSLCQLSTKLCCWGGWGVAMLARSQGQSFRCGLFGQNEVYKQPPSCKWFILWMECTGWMVLQRFTFWVGIFLALWRVDRWVKIQSVLVRYWVTSWCFVYFIIKLVTFIHEGLCTYCMMFRLIIGRFVFGKGIVAAIRLRVWLSGDW